MTDEYFNNLVVSPSVDAIQEFKIQKSQYPAEYRIYTREHLERVEFIKKCQTLGFSLDEIRDLMELKFRGNSTCQHVRDLLADKNKRG